MIRDSTSQPATSHGPILTDRRDLVDGINDAFLLERLALPTGLDGERLVCAVTRIDDTDTIAALAFASGREVIPLLATTESILAAIVQPAARPASTLNLLSVRHAQAVVLLRRHIVEASSHCADALRIVVNDDGGKVLAIGDDQSTELSRLSHRDARALIAAADALAAAGQDGGTGFAVNVAGDLHRAIVEPAEDGRIVRFGMSGIDTAP
jgi:hypothetical protein